MKLTGPDPRVDRSIIAASNITTSAMLTLGKLVAFILFCFFAWGTYVYLVTYFERQIGTVVSTEINDTRQFPSLSICLVKRNTSLAPIVADLDGTLEQTREEVISSLQHSVLSKFG